jgi:hypothetical protein
MSSTQKSKAIGAFGWKRGIVRLKLQSEHLARVEGEIAAGARV